MEVVVQSYTDQIVLTGILKDLEVFRFRESDLADMNRLPPIRSQQSRSPRCEPLIKQESAHAT